MGVAQLVLGVALVGLLALWSGHLTRLMTSPDGSTLQAGESARRGAGAHGPGCACCCPGRTGTVMVASLRYVWRDPKTKPAWVTSLAIAIVPVFNALQGTGSIDSGVLRGRDARHPRTTSSVRTSRVLDGRDDHRVPT